MNTMEVILVLLGFIVFAVSFLLPPGNQSKTEDLNQISEEQIREIVEKEVEAAKEKISDIVDETITYSMEKTERSMDRLTNEKMLAVNEYSDTVLEQINKNHKEAVFLYDMLNDKHENLKTTVSQAVKTEAEVKQTVQAAEVVVKEAEFIPIQPQKVEVVIPVAKAEQELPNPEGLSQTEIHSSELQTANISLEKDSAENHVTDSIADGKAPAKKAATGEKTGKTEAEAAGGRKSKTQGKTAAPKVDISLNAQGRTGGRNNNERILELHEAGKSNMAIAKELGLGIGEVKLVIDLFEGI